MVDDKFVMDNPRTGEKYTFDVDVLKGNDWTGMSQNADNLFTPEEIKNYHEFALKGPSNAYKDLTDLGPEIKDFWIQEIWDRVNPGIKILSHSINTNNDSSWLPNGKLILGLVMNIQLSCI